MELLAQFVEQQGTRFHGLQDFFFCDVEGFRNFLKIDFFVSGGFLGVRLSTLLTVL